MKKPYLNAQQRQMIIYFPNSATASMLKLELSKKRFYRDLYRQLTFVCVTGHL